MADIDDHIAYEYAAEAVAKLRMRLRAAGRGSGLSLTPEECERLALHLADPVRPKGRPPTSGTRIAYIAGDCHAQEHAGVRLKDAAAATAAKFGVSVSTVMAARDKVK